MYIHAVFFRSFSHIGYSKFPTCEPSSCKLSKMRVCIRFQQGARTCAIDVRHEWHCSLPSVSYRWRPFSSAISHLLSLLQSVTLLACSLHASSCVPAVVLSVQFSRSVMSDSLRPRALQQARPPCIFRRDFQRYWHCLEKTENNIQAARIKENEILISGFIYSFIY